MPPWDVSWVVLMTAVFDDTVNGRSTSGVESERDGQEKEGLVSRAEQRLGGFYARTKECVRSSLI